jgi:hypothetical protein
MRVMCRRRGVLCWMVARGRVRLDRMMAVAGVNLMENAIGIEADIDTVLSQCVL